MTHLTPEAKAKLARTIRDFRGTASDPNGGSLLKGMREAAEGTYRLSITPAHNAGLAEEQLKKRLRLEEWLGEQVRADMATQKPKDKNEKKLEQESWERHLTNAIKLAGATVLNRLVVIKQLEARGMVKPAVVTGGWNSSGYKEFREFAPDLCKGETEGYGLLLKLLCDELALELPGLFGSVGLTELFEVPASTLRNVVDGLNAPALESAWTDDTTLGWVYQYWNDPEREALDAKLNDGGKVAPHEIASKTQMFTERYMVEWLLQNSLGQQWLAICAQNGWQPEAVADGTLTRLEDRRKGWREKRESGEVALDALMPIETEQEERWKYWVQQPALAGEGIPNSIRELKIFDPACGSGHFLVIAFDLLFAFYTEEARHRGQTGEESWSEREIVESILENNLFGLDLDARAVQIAAAALYLKGKAVCAGARPKALNLVASNLNLAALPEGDKARAALRVAVETATGVPGALTDEIVEALKGADAWGSLLQVDQAVDRAITAYEQGIQQDLLKDEKALSGSPLLLSGKQREGPGVRVVLLAKLEDFLTRYTHSDDLGLRLKGEQLAAGVRFIRIVREGAYDLVIGNPPYQGANEIADSSYLEDHYQKAKSDLYTAFLNRGLQLVKPGGLSALLTMRNWMFTSQFSFIRKHLIETFELRIIGDLGVGAFEEISGHVVSVTMSIFRNIKPTPSLKSIACSPALSNGSGLPDKFKGKKIEILIQVNRFNFETNLFTFIDDEPIIYWWDKSFLSEYSSSKKIGDESDVRVGLQTSDNPRFLRQNWEVNLSHIFIGKTSEFLNSYTSKKWSPYIKGAAGKKWFEPLSEIVLWCSGGLEIKNFSRSYVKNERYYFSYGIAFSMIGNRFSARAHRFKSIFGNKGSSVFPEIIPNSLCLLNSLRAKDIANSLNPGTGYEVGDVKRLPLFPIESATEIFTQLEAAFTTHESAREPSVEFIHPAPTCWPYAQAWAQRAVDRPAGEPLPPWEPEYEQPLATDWISYAIGLALGRFPLATGLSPAETLRERLRSGLGQGSSGLEEGKTPGQSTRALSAAEVPALSAVEGLPHGILYLSAYSASQPDAADSLSHPACAPLTANWTTHSSQITKKPLHDWLRLNFFKDIHLGMYEQRPIYFPLSSANKNFVALISIHRWDNNTLKDLLAEYLTPDLIPLTGELNDLAESKNQGDAKTQTQTENRYAHLQTLHTELTDFIALVRQCAETGPLPANPKDPHPEASKVSYQMDLDDGVMINSAALWPLLEPQWKKPKTWWHELCTAKGKKDYDWSHLAARYFPTRVDAKCQQDPSLAVAHGCFWQYHPAKATEWELRLQDEIGPGFTIDEANSNALRQQFETEHPDIVQALKEKEEKRRERKYKKQEKDQLALDV